jgi:biopolymer transport protein ExbD
VGMQLPESVQGQSNTATLVLEMQESGDVLLDSVRTSRDALPQALGELREKRPKEDLLTLKIDRRIAHGEVVALMDLAREAGFQKVAFGVSPSSSGANAPR